MSQKRDNAAAAAAKKIDPAKIDKTIKDVANTADAVTGALPSIKHMVGDIIDWLKSIGKHDKNHKQQLAKQVAIAAAAGQVNTDLKGAELHTAIAEEIAKHD